MVTVNPGHYALVVGIDHYPRFRSLKGARKDAEEFHAWLVDSGGGGVPQDNAALVLSEESPSRPIHEDIDDALEDLMDKARASAGPGARRFYLYFSGHGLGRSNLGVDLCLARWSKSRRTMALDSQGYLRLAMGCGLFTEVVFLMDCCRVREIRAGALPPTIEPPAPGDGAPVSRSFVAYATEFMNAAYEARTGTGSDGEDVRGHFTRALMAALMGAAAEPEGGVRASRLKQYIEVNTPLIARAANHLQRPEVVNGLDAENDPLFGSAKPSRRTVTVVIAFAPGTVGDVVVEDGQLRELRRGDAVSGPWRIVLDEPTRLGVRSLGDGREITVRVRGDETEDVHVSF